MAELTFQKRSDIVARSTGMLWGNTKVGKTTFLSSLPHPILYIVTDPNGYAVLPSTKDIVLLDLSTMADRDMADFCIDKLGTYIEQKMPDNIESVVFDSLTSLGQASLVRAVKAGVGSGKGFTPTMDAPGLAAYGARTQTIITTCRNLLRSTARREVHCWFTAHEDTPETDDKGNFLYITLNLSGKTINDTGLQLNEIWHMRQTTAGERFIAVRPTRGFQPMGSRMFREEANKSEFKLKFDPDKGPKQPHSLTSWIEKWRKNDYRAIELPT